MVLDAVRRVRLRAAVQSSLWVLPAICTGVAALAAFALMAFDRQADPARRLWGWEFAGNAASAGTVLSTIAGSMITIAGTIYSLTIVALTLASSQFAPRVLGSFIRDRVTKIVLGFFVATFTYSLLVLRALRDDFVPSTAVGVAIILALISVGLLIYFINHIFHGIQISTILAHVAQQTAHQIDLLYPQPWRAGDRPESPRAVAPADAAVVSAQRSGYLQFVDHHALLHWATAAGATVYEERSVGAFVIAGTPLLRITPMTALAAAPPLRLERAFLLGRVPTIEQDIAFGIRQLVDVALKAISPAVNDPTTAVNCLDHLGAVLAHMARRRMPERDLSDAQGCVRVLVPERTFHDLVRLAFDQIRHYGAGDHVIVVRMFDTLAAIGQITPNPLYRAALREYLEHTADFSQLQIHDPYEQQVIVRHLLRVRLALGAAGSAAP
ncbi:MAG: DUF2254 domain-containing protein [Chloroflexota bacterium]|nr:DUF2254 domain-containing protein [Chloroflexota bacterium]